MSNDEYVPSGGDLYEQIAKRRYEYDYTSPWEHLAPAPRKILTQAARNTMEPIIARVRREALNGLAEWYQETADLFDKHSGSPEDREHRDESLNRKAETLTYRDTFHPEETHGR